MLLALCCSVLILTLNLPAVSSDLKPCFSPDTSRAQKARAPIYMFTNVMEGGRDRVPFLEQFVAARNNTLEVIGLSELNGWQAKRLAKFGHRFGFNHSVFVDAPTGYHLGAISKTPITVLHSNSAPPMHHGVAIFRVDDGTVVVLTHMSPRNSEARLVEASYIVHHLKVCCKRLPILVRDTTHTSVFVVLVFHL